MNVESQKYVRDDNKIHYSYQGWPMIAYAKYVTRSVALTQLTKRHKEGIQGKHIHCFPP